MKILFKQIYIWLMLALLAKNKSDILMINQLSNLGFHLNCFIKYKHQKRISTVKGCLKKCIYILIIYSKKIKNCYYIYNVPFV